VGGSDIHAARSLVGCSAWRGERRGAPLESEPLGVAGREIGGSPDSPHADWDTLYAARMRAIVIVGVMWFAMTNAHADAITVLGWATDGGAMIEIDGKELHKCAPTSFKDLDKPSCKRCGAAGDAAKSCGLTTKAVASLVAAGAKLTLKKGGKRITQQSDGGDYWLWFELPDRRSVEFTLAAGYKTPPTGDAYFRPDGKAVALYFKATDHEAKRADEVRVLDVARLHEISEAPAALRALVTEQLGKLSSSTWATTSAAFATDDAARGAFDAGKLGAALGATGVVKPDRIDVSLTETGESAFLTMTATIDKVVWRATQLATYDGGWKIAGGFWSRGMADADAWAKAAAGQLPKLTPIAGKNRLENLSGWLDRLRTGDKESGPLGAKRKDTITIGTQPKERVAGGKLLDAAFAGWRKGGFKIPVALGEAVPAAGWILLDIEVTRKKAGKSVTLPVRAWLAFESVEAKPMAGADAVEGIVVAHFAVPR